jgi:uncharacterized NAD(P)/FAD-binding protein YdhS
MWPRHRGTTVTTIVIVGGGFSGVAVAIRILRSAGASDVTVVVIDKSQRFGRGVAYATTSPFHLLNAPAGSMSAFEELPTDFVDFCKRFDPSVTGASYVSRCLYGEYMEVRLEEAEQASDVRLLRVHGVVKSVSDSSADTCACVRLTDGRKFLADYVILAIGDAPQRGPFPASSCDEVRTAYVENPWQQHGAGRIDGGVSLVLGAGLTAVDIAIDLVKERGARNVVLLSRRGLKPHTQVDMPSTRRDVTSLLPPGILQDGLVGKLRAVRAFARAHQMAESDWRTAVGELRSFVPGMWCSLSQRDKQRFIRRLRPFWDIHRHRCAPATAEILDQLIKKKLVRFVAGELCALRWVKAGVEATIRSRKCDPMYSLVVDQVVNCTGSGGPGTVIQGTLLQRLVEDGIVTFDLAGIGIETTDTYHVVGVNGRRANSVHYVGPLLRARYWEATAVPELRVHCTRLVAEVLSNRVDVERAKRRANVVSQHARAPAALD